MWTVIAILAVASLICGILNALSPPRCPIWVPVILLSIIALLQVLPKG